VDEGVTEEKPDKDSQLVLVPGLFVGGLAIEVEPE